MFFCSFHYGGKITMFCLMFNNMPVIFFKKWIPLALLNPYSFRRDIYGTIINPQSQILFARHFFQTVAAGGLWSGKGWPVRVFHQKGPVVGFRR